MIRQREIEDLPNRDLITLVLYGNNRRADLEARRRKLSVAWERKQFALAC